MESQNVNTDFGLLECYDYLSVGLDEFDNVIPFQKIENVDFPAKLNHVSHVFF